MAEFDYDQNSLDMADILPHFQSHITGLRHGRPTWRNGPDTRKVIMEIVTNRPLDPAAMFEKIRKSEAGSVLLHYAVVKSQTGGRVSAGIHFEKAGDIEGELHALAADIKQRWKIEDVLLVRRIGTLEIGDIISLIAVSSPDSNDAFEACRSGLGKFKKMTTLKKTERFLGKERT
jgi:molybdopterin synthase catalytic subunit